MRTLVVFSDPSEKEKNAMTGKYKWVQTVGINEIRELERKGNEIIRKDIKVEKKKNGGKHFCDQSEKKGDWLLLQSL